jgi:hypothetical protein
MMPHLRIDASPLNIGRPFDPATEWPMQDANENRSILKTVLTDPQFWVPVAVLVAGLIVLRWIS